MFSLLFISLCSIYAAKYEYITNPFTYYSIFQWPDESPCNKSMTPEDISLWFTPLLPKSRESQFCLFQLLEVEKPQGYCDFFIQYYKNMAFEDITTNEQEEFLRCVTSKSWAILHHKLFASSIPKDTFMNNYIKYDSAIKIVTITIQFLVDQAVPLEILKVVNLTELWKKLNLNISHYERSNTELKNRDIMDYLRANAALLTENLADEIEPDDLDRFKSIFVPYMGVFEVSINFLNTVIDAAVEQKMELITGFPKQAL